MSVIHMATPLSVSDFIDRLQLPVRDLVQSLCTIIQSAHPEETEHIKWNSPAFYYSGPMQDFDPKTYKRDIAVMNLRQKEGILLIFPNGASLPDPSGLKETAHADGRAILRFKSTAEIYQRADALRKMICDAVAAVALQPG
jgi:hypothetical protein